MYTITPAFNKKNSYITEIRCINRNFMFITVLYIFNIFVSDNRIILPRRFITLYIHDFRPSFKCRIYDAVFFFHTAIIHFVRKLRTAINHIFLQIIVSVGPNISISPALPHLKTTYLGNLSHVESHTFPHTCFIIMETVSVIITLPDIPYRQTAVYCTVTRQTGHFTKFRLVKFLLIQRIAFQFQGFGIIIPAVTNSIS